MDWRAARARGGRRRRVVARSARGSQPGGERDGRARGARARWTETACEDISRVLRARRCLLRATRPSRSSHAVSPSEVKCVSSSPKRVVVSRPRPTLRFRRHRRPRACPTGRAGKHELPTWTNPRTSTPRSRSPRAPRWDTASSPRSRSSESASRRSASVAETDAANATPSPGEPCARSNPVRPYRPSQECTGETPRDGWSTPFRSARASRTP